MLSKWLLVIVTFAFGCQSREQVPDAERAPPQLRDAPPLGDAPPLRDGEPAPFCASFDRERSVFFGDLHVHTSYSLDAYQFQTRTDPAGAYSFGRGGPIPLAPAGTVARTATLPRPLDFMAVTDHAEYFGITPPSGGSAATAWQREQLAAEEAYDRSPSCSFTTFIAYEWSGATVPGNEWLHRNVIFRNSHVPALPISAIDQPTPEGLWGALTTACLDAGDGCDVIAIPHNSNYSHGRMFSADNLSVAQAATRQRLEPLAEIFQYKGSSECSLGADGAVDAECLFEQELRYDCSGVITPLCAAGSWVRSALKRGLQVEQAIGVNPFRLGLVGGSDTHNATAGATDEWDFQGHHGIGDADPLLRLSTAFYRHNPGGLTAVWSEQNTREDLFVALRRRETYATSGTRPKVRFFAGFELPTDLCGRDDLVAIGYARGVPMGGELGTSPSGASPVFVVSAMKDTGVDGHPGNQLQQLQIIKGWVDAAGATHEQVVRVAGSSDDGSAVNPGTCEAIQHGPDTLCGTWTDPDFQPNQRAFYYVRLLEDPTCAARQRDCLSIPVAQRPPACSDPKVQLVINERAWTSPIWYTPPPHGG
jgi:hypothetical protein